MVVLSPNVDVQRLQELSRQIRMQAITTAHRTKSGHLGSSFSIVDILAALYFSFLRINPDHPKDPARDRFILSKGHGCLTLYVALALRGFFPVEELSHFIQDESRLPGHPSSKMLPGIEASTGSLGHGLSIGVGMALAAKRDGAAYRTVVIVSDGECDEGSTWEAILTAGHWKLGSLTCIVDYNKIQSFGRVSEVLELEPFAQKWEAFGWHTQEVNGHDHEEILEALQKTEGSPDQPSVIITHTVKGKGLSYIEDTVESHYWPPKDEQFAAVMAEFSR